MAEESAPEVAKPFYASPFFIAFVCGAIALTLMPILQKKFLKAAPPLGELPEFSLTQIGEATTFSKDNFKNHIWILSMFPADCTGHCLERQSDFAKAKRNVADLKVIELMRLVAPESVVAVAALEPALPSLQLGTTNSLGFENALKDFWKIQGTGEIPVGAVTSWGTFIVIDEKAQVRGFWPDDIAGLGNAINAARLLAKQNLSHLNN